VAKPEPQKFPPSAEFKKDFYTAALRAGIKVASFGPEGALIVVHGDERTFHFVNVRPRWERAAPENREDLLYFSLTAPFEAELSAEDATLEQARGKLMPLLRDPSVGHRGPDGDEVPSRPFVPGHLSIYLVVDEPATMWFVLAEHLKRWKTTFEDLLPIAMDHLRRVTPWQEIGKVPDRELFFYASEDSYDATRALLIKDLVHPWPKSGVVLAIPSRDHFMYAPVDGQETLRSLDAMAQLITRFTAVGTYLISDQIFWYDGETWEELETYFEDGKSHLRPSDRFKAVISAWE
jgi:uncharacterized protein YtpQ (UPF0354 family)